MKTIERSLGRRVAALALPFSSVAAVAAIAAIALGAVACAAPAGDVGEDVAASPAAEDEVIAEQSSALRNTGGGGDPDECTAALGGCYAHCKTSGSSACYRYCDIVYAKCRGLPSPELSSTVRASVSP